MSNRLFAVVVTFISCFARANNAILFHEQSYRGKCFSALFKDYFHGLIFSRRVNLLIIFFLPTIMKNSVKKLIPVDKRNLKCFSFSLG